MPDETVDQTSSLPPLSLGTRWAIAPHAMAQIIEAQRRPGAADTIRALGSAGTRPQAARRTTGQRAGGAVAVLPLTGVITPRGSFFSYLFGGGAGGLMEFREMFRDAVQSPDVGAIVIDVDSPGGLIDLVPETAAEIREARGIKPIVAVANTFAASAAYWIAAQADEIVVTPSGDVGSIGVYRVHEDWSSWNEKFGIAVTYVHAGEFKVEGNPDAPLSDGALEDWQEKVEDLYTMFVDDVAGGRDTTADVVRTTYGEGRTMNAQRAVQAGMADRIATLEAVIGELLSPGNSGGASARGRAAKLVAAAPPPAEPESDDPASQAADASEPAPSADAHAGDQPEGDTPESDETAEQQPAALDAAQRASIADVLIG